MLVLSRKEGETFYIGQDVIITVQSVRGDRVKIAIEAPKSVQILRKELFDARELNKEAALSEANAIERLRSSLKL